MEIELKKIFSKKNEIIVKNIHDNFVKILFEREFKKKYNYVYSLMNNLNQDGYRLGKYYVSLYKNKYNINDIEIIKLYIEIDPRVYNLREIERELETVKKILYKLLYESRISSCNHELIITNINNLIKDIDNIYIKFKHHEIYNTEDMQVQEEIEIELYEEEIINKYIKYELSILLNE